MPMIRQEKPSVCRVLIFVDELKSRLGKIKIPFVRREYCYGLFGL